MSTDPSPLKYMGTQSQETVNMAAAIAQRAARGAEQGPPRTTEKFLSEVAEVSRSAVPAGSKISDAAYWAAGQVKDTTRAAAKQLRQRARQAAETYTRDDPVRSILIAAGMGALLMGLAAMMARSGVRSVQRKVGR